MEKQKNTTMKPLNQNKMKTAVQEHIEWLKATIEIAEEQAPILVSSLKLCLGDATQKLELEKQQIMKAVYDSMGTNLDPNIGRAELYYNETYNK